jgi:hypothetical protein
MKCHAFELLCQVVKEKQPQNGHSAAVSRRNNTVQRRTKLETEAMLRAAGIKL